MGNANVGDDGVNVWDDIGDVHDDIDNVHDDIGNVHNDIGSVHNDTGNVYNNIGNVRNNMGSVLYISNQQMGKFPRFSEKSQLNAHFHLDSGKTFREMPFPIAEVPNPITDCHVICFKVP